MAYWLITRNVNGRMEMLTLDRDGRKMLPVFSHEEEAEMFLRLGGIGENWRITESEAKELVSVLHRAGAGVKDVALDPLPEMAAERLVGLVSQARERFIECIMVRRPLRLWERRQRNRADMIATPRPP